MQDISQQMCANELQQGEVTVPHPKKLITKTESGKKVKAAHKKTGDVEISSGKCRSKSESDSNTEAAESLGFPWKSEQSLSDILKLLQSMKDHEIKKKVCKEVTGSDTVKQEAENSGKVDPSGVTDRPPSVETAEKRMPDRPGTRVRSWSESAKDQDVFVAGMGDHSSYTSVRSKDDTPERRKSQAETLAGCLSDQNDNDIVSCGKLVVDHIFDRLSSTEFSRSAVKLKGLTSIDEVRKVLLSSEFAESKLTPKEENPDKNIVHSRIDHLVTEAYPKEKCATETKHKVEVTKEYSPILRVPDFKSFLETEGNQKKSSSDANVVQAKKRTMTLPLEEVKTEPVEDVGGLTPESRADRSDQDCYGGLEDDGKDRDDGSYQPVRKSRRRNRGQRYLELINEGIIQPSKERLAARRAEQTSTDDET